MALYDTIASALGPNVANDGEEINLKIKPANQMAAATAPAQELQGASSAPATPGATGAGGSAAAAPAGVSALAAPAANPATVVPPVNSVLPPEQRLSKNLQLVAAPAGAFTDSQFEADYAQAVSDRTTQYADVLEQLGYVDAEGKFIPGAVEQAAARQSAQLTEGMKQAGEQVKGNARRGNSVFSGRYAQNTQNATAPFAQALAQLAADTPNQLAKLFSQGSGIRDNFSLILNSLLAAAASRRVPEIQANPTGPAADETPASIATAQGNDPYAAQPTFAAQPGGGYAPVPGLPGQNVPRGEWWAQ